MGAEAEALARQYGDVAMGFLDALFVSLMDRASAAGDLLAAGTIEDVLGELERGWDATEHRIDNWSGRLVELANSVGIATVLEASSFVIDPETGAEREDPYWGLWADVSDERECETCIDEAAIGWRPIADFTRVPGGDTICRARCRCVILVRRRSEVP